MKQLKVSGTYRPKSVSAKAWTKAITDFAEQARDKNLLIHNGEVVLMGLHPHRVGLRYEKLGYRVVVTRVGKLDAEEVAALREAKKAKRSNAPKQGVTQESAMAVEAVNEVGKPTGEETDATQA